ncbi:hypothetical protein [Nonomuraea recticatena]|uniref:Uncharacterized protein n=1 Tax=Nonomuraea recticatena TaxID=46178 RepID=A0ABP6EF60_9ACTN
MHFPGIRIEGLFDGTLTLRRILVLVNRLLGMLGKSALAVALLGEAASWSNEEYILADLYDEIAVGNWMFVTAHRTDDQASIPTPPPYRRPGHSAEPANDESTYDPPPPEQFATAVEIHGVLSSLVPGQML